MKATIEVGVLARPRKTNGDHYLQYLPIEVTIPEDHSLLEELVSLPLIMKYSEEWEFNKIVSFRILDIVTPDSECIFTSPYNGDSE